MWSGSQKILTGQNRSTRR